MSFFFGSKNFAWILDENIVPHSKEMLNKLSKKKSSSYAKAIDEIVEASLAIVPKPDHVKKNNVENGDLDKIFEIPSIKEDEFCKKPRIRIVRRDRPTKQKIDSTLVDKSRPSLDLSKPSIPFERIYKTNFEEDRIYRFGNDGAKDCEKFLAFRA
ncbi:oxidoreductase GLYR1 [Trichonephila clavata]|uniref:Oxidoreductase GLYR1 n=1 Tax=Trichonephila clavata TaxID=2740835 RepID=A0A8X6LPS1_TRICU|nr:oxidoreductase GLYR1 [Trichonephila clavata]